MSKTVFVDVHCHLEACEDIGGAVKRAREAGVEIILTQGTSVDTNRRALELYLKYKEVKAALGLYPIDALKMNDDEIDKEIEFIRKNRDKIVGIGEVGIDFKESLEKEEHERQKKIFEKFVDLSIELDKPIIVHSRKAELECIEILEKLGAKKVIMHCFCGKRKLVERILNNKWYLTVPTSVKNSQQFQDNAEIAPIEQLFCETDSPFLHPDKLNNNEPANVIVSYKKIAEIKKIKVEEVKKCVFKNYIRFFRN